MTRTDQSGGGSQSRTLLVISAILFVVSGGMLIVAGSHKDKLVQERDAAINELKQYISEQEQVSPEVLELKARVNSDGTSTGTVYHQLLEENRKLKIMIVGEPASAERIRSEILALNIDPRDNASLVEQIKSLRQESQDSEERAGRPLRRMEYHQEMAEAWASLEQHDKANRELIDQLQATLTSQKNQFVDYQAKADAQVRQMHDENKKLLEENSMQIAQKDQQIVNLREEVLSERPWGRRTRTLMPELSSKGSIITVDNDQHLVNINRGRYEHVTKGLTFEVFDSITGVVADPRDRDNFQGKATIEVVSISEHSSVCRVVRIESEAKLVEGDVLGNVVYDPDAHYKFVVFGDFDLHNTGQVQWDDRQQVRTMISNWGGVLQDTINSDTDYVVLGAEPLLPDPLPFNTVDPVQIQRHGAQLARYDAFQKVVKNAREMGIPILNQNRFLSLVGYYQR